MTDITNRDDVVRFVNEFYNLVAKDELIGPIFNSKIPADKWPIHLERMYKFWNTVLFGKIEYRGNPFSHHISLPIHEEHFDRSVSLFENTILKFYKGPKADEAIMRANKMRLMFETKLKAIRSNPNMYPLM